MQGIQKPRMVLSTGLDDVPEQILIHFLGVSHFHIIFVTRTLLSLSPQRFSCFSAGSLHRHLGGNSLFLMPYIFTTA